MNRSEDNLVKQLAAEATDNARTGGSGCLFPEQFVDAQLTLEEEHHSGIVNFSTFVSNEELVVEVSRNSINWN